MAEDELLELIGANMDIDLTSGDKAITWQQAKCPWNAAEKSATHKCVVKNTSICKYFHGIKKWDIVLCSYPHIFPEATE